MDKARIKLRNVAILMRKSGLSYGEISKKTHIPKSTLSLWLKDIKLPLKYRKKFYTKQIQILSRGPQSQRERRKREIESILKSSAEDIKTPVSEDAFKLFGAALYWGEGSKGSRLQITNSDPRLIVFMTHWFEKIFCIKRSKMKARLNIYPQQNDLEMKKFWSDITEIPISNFGKSYIKPLNSGYRKNNLYYGTIRIEIPKSADLVHKVFSWTQIMTKTEKERAKKIEKKWIRLTNTKRPANLNSELPS